MAVYMAYRAAEQAGGRARSLRIRVGGLPQDLSRRRLWRSSRSRAATTRKYPEPAFEVRDGKTITVKTMDEVESIVDGFGRSALSGHRHARRPRDARRLFDLDYKTIRYAGHAVIVGAMRDLDDDARPDDGDQAWRIVRRERGTGSPPLEIPPLTRRTIARLKRKETQLRLYSAR